MKKKIARIISVLTVVPIIAFFIVTFLYIKYKFKFYNIKWYIYSLFFLTILPISAYPLKNIIPKYKNKGRKGERKLAFILAVLGYVCGSILAFIIKAPVIVKEIFLAYVVSGGVLFFVNKVITLKASGHACGVSGPITLLCFFGGYKMLWLLLILPIVFWARVQLKRHTFKELIAGTLVGIFSTFIAINVYLNII